MMPLTPEQEAARLAELEAAEKEKAKKKEAKKAGKKGAKKTDLDEFLDSRNLVGPSEIVASI